MTIDEAIEHAIEVAEENRIYANSIESNMYLPLSADRDRIVDWCIKCAEEHEQLAKWLNLLKWYEQGMEDIPTESGVMPKDIYHTGYYKGRADTINELMVELYPCRYVYDDDCMKCQLRGTCKIEYFENELEKLEGHKT